MNKNHKTQKVIIYGDSDFAEQVYYQLETDGRYKILAFTVDESKFEKNTFIGLPVIPFQQLSNHYSTNEVQIFPAIGYSKLNTIREIVTTEIEQAGYKLFTYISKKAHVSINAEIGYGCYICEFVSIGSNSKIGKSTIILPHASIAHDVNISSFSFLSHSTIIGGYTSIKKNTFFGLGSIVKNNITVDEFNIIGAASNVLKSTEPNGIYIGNPAKRLKDVDINNLNF